MAKILVVDDEVEIRELLRDALAMKGYEVTTVPDEEQVFMQELKQMPVSGGMMVDDPQTKKEKKFLLLENMKKN